MTDTDLCYLAATELRQKFADRELSPVEVTEATLDRIESLIRRSMPTSPLRRNGQWSRQGLPRRSISWASCAAPCATVERRWHGAAWQDEHTRTGLEGGLWQSRYGADTQSVASWAHPRRLKWWRSSGRCCRTWTLVTRHGRRGVHPDSCGSVGAFGFKPTWGSVPQFPASVVQALSHAGPITRTVGDAVMMLQAMAGADERDRSSMQPEPVTLTDIEDGIAGIRVASESAGSMAHRTCHVVYRFRRLLSRQFLCCARSTDARTGGRHRAGVRFQWCRCGRCLHPAQRLLRIVACFSSDLRSCADTNAAVNGF
mgnify:CR=1 FL=1